jgi:AraC-like DNA-binding protein
MKNINETLLLVASIQGFLLFFALITKKTNNRLSNVAISIIIFVITITVLFSWGSVSHYNNSPKAIPFWTLHSYLLIPASFWIFLEVNTNPTFRFLKKYWLLFLPALIDIFIQVILKILPQLIDNQMFISFIKSRFWFFFIEILPLFSTILIQIVYVRKLLLLRQKFKQFKSSTFNSYFKRMFLVLALMSILLIVWTASTYYLIPYKIVEVTLVTFIFLLGYLAYFKPDFFEIPKENLLKNHSANPFSNFDDKVELEKLNSIFKEQSLHLKPKLSISELANELSLPPKYVTYLIGNYHSKNFNDFVNTFRVKEVIERMGQPSEKHKSLLGIALDAGFNSKSSFNQVFKEHTGKTPSQYLGMSPES